MFFKRYVGLFYIYSFKFNFPQGTLIKRFSDENPRESQNIEKQNSKVKKFKPIDILKIAACTILSVLLWQAMSLPPESVMSQNEESKTYFTINTNDFYRKINQFMFKQINIERGDK